eukprot:SAG22_NODE_193_length_15643_cov_5.339424_2_plen_63_part_00
MLWSKVLSLTEKELDAAVFAKQYNVMYMCDGVILTFQDHILFSLLKPMAFSEANGIQRELCI